MIWSKGIKAVSDTKKMKLVTVQNGGLKHTSEDSIKMSIKLYSFLEQKTENWQDEYRLNVLTTLTNMYLTEAFY
jgi:hypothetical protein